MPEWHPLFLLTTIGILLGAIFLFITYHEFCLERLVWYESLLVLLCVLSLESLMYTHFWESQKLCYACSYASLKFLEPWICSSTSLISFWARRALLFLKKCSHASLRFIWEWLIFDEILSCFTYIILRDKFFYAHVLHLNLFESLS